MERKERMNRTANCIRMLILLKSRGLVSIRELAQIIGCNERNIREYRKDLEKAGYSIKGRRGVGGGYELDRTTLIALPDLNSQEIEALRKTRDFISSQTGFPFTKESLAVMDQILSQTAHPLQETPIYFVGENGQHLSEKGMVLLNTIRKAMVENQTLEMSYLSRANTQPLTRLVDPYAIICMEGRWYFCGFDHLHQEYRNYRISEQRIVELYSSFHHFTRDPEFRLRDHIGKTTIVPTDTETYEVEVRKDQKRFFEEIDWGDEFQELESKGEWCRFSFQSNNPEQVMRLLYSMKANVRLMAPSSRVEQYVKGMKDILANYE